MDKLTDSINPKYHKIIKKILLNDSITVIYNELLPSLPNDVVNNLYINIKNNLNLFTPEQKEKLKPIVTYYTSIKFPCSTNCNPINNTDRSPLHDKEYGTKKDCLSKCPKKVSITNVTDENLLLSMSFLSLEDKLQYLISINKKALISKIQERDIYNPDIIIKESSPVEKEFRPYVIIAYESEYKKKEEEYKKVKYIYSTGNRSENLEYDFVKSSSEYGKEIIINIRSNELPLVLHGKPLKKEETNHLRKLELLGGFNQPLGDSLSKLTQLETLKFGDEFDQPLGDSLSTLTQLKSLKFGDDFDQPLGDSLSKLTQLKSLKFGFRFNQYINDSLKKLTKLKTLKFGDEFKNGNKPLEPFLSTLKQLENLDLGKYDLSSLSTLTQLKKLTIGDGFNKYLELSRLKQLESLTFGEEFNQPLGTILEKLTQLKILKFGDDFNNGDEPLGTSLEKLTQLEKLKFGENFNNGDEPLGTSLEKLTHLKVLEMVSYTSFLGDSLSKLTQLKKLYLPSYNLLLGDSLSKLTQLEKLSLNSYTHTKKDILKLKFPQLKKLWLNNKYYSMKSSDQKVKSSFSFTTPVNKNSKEELREMNFDQLKQCIKDLRREGYKISVLSKMEDKADNRKLLRRILRDVENKKFESTK
jgi:hypothetical protein